MAGADEVAAAIVRAVEEAGTEGKPVLACVISTNGIPTQFRSGIVAPFPYRNCGARTRAGGRACGVVAQAPGPCPGTWRHRSTRRSSARRREFGGLARSRSHAPTPRGLRTAPRVRASCGVGEDAVVAADELGYPVVVKTAEAGAHKTESGGVAVDLRDSEAVSEAAQRIGAPLLVQPMVQGGIELLVGAVQDPVFGPLVALGPGGTLAELIGDAAFRLTPLTDFDAQEPAHGEGRVLLSGFRGAPPSDPEAVQDLLLRVSQLAEDLPELAELDLNPVIAGRPVAS